MYNMYAQYMYMQMQIISCSVCAYIFEISIIFCYMPSIRGSAAQERSSGGRGFEGFLGEARPCHGAQAGGLQRSAGCGGENGIL